MLVLTSVVCVLGPYCMADVYSFAKFYSLGEELVT